jgi:hypothetical protein
MTLTKYAANTDGTLTRYEATTSYAAADVDPSRLDYVMVSKDFVPAAMSRERSEQHLSGELVAYVREDGGAWHIFTQTFEAPSAVDFISAVAPEYTDFVQPLTPEICLVYGMHSAQLISDMTTVPGTASPVVTSS